MPTGYTHELMDKGQDFRTFALLCARAMGACVMQRDDPMGELPKKQEPGDYNTKRLSEARAERDRLSVMDSDQQFKLGCKLKTEAVNNAAEYLQREKDQNARLDTMMVQVVAWQPPTSEHAGLKSFMVEQMTISRNDISYAEKRLMEVTGKPWKRYFEEACEHAQRDIEYHTKEAIKEQERTDGRNGWIEALYASLPTGSDISNYSAGGSDG